MRRAKPPHTPPVTRRRFAIRLPMSHEGLTNKARTRKCRYPGSDRADDPGPEYLPRGRGPPTRFILNTAPKLRAVVVAICFFSKSLTHVACGTPRYLVDI
ncbi:hypothetical protein DPEC_G00184950 [Dallia pectoralis]|uniref:Uncharacterized protein n=1 Tax=Dallia pectoralis TaxID=75939 RepID=A0ACC2GBG5_DALPE|nr:hypothetical protein DPEC_G00184950 [Dallia pectoralis]